MSLYTKYRPRDWDSVIGQDSISTILRTALQLDRVGHAYIFTGSRGTGKTTSARILAKGVNCKNLQEGNPCHECENCKAFDAGNMLDVIEIDGASNNGVENVRDLIEKARFEPNQGKYKIYIIDEVHMLSTGAFNALLKTLEEPPAHVKFILATTEIEKVPETIRSRSLRFDFRKITEADLVKRLLYVVEAEGIKAEQQAIAIIAKAARGGMRDALTLLEQHTINNEVSTEYVRTSLSLLEESLIDEVIDTILERDVEKIFHILEVLGKRHVLVRGFFDQILYVLRDRIFASVNTPLFHEYEAIFAIFESAYSKIKVIPDSMLLIEITLIRAVKRGEKPEAGEPIAKKDPVKKSKTETQLDSTEVQNTKKDEGKGGHGDVYSMTEKVEEQKAKSIVNEPDTPIHKAAVSKEEAKKLLQEEKNESPSFSFILLLNALKSSKPALVVDLKSAQFEVQGTTLKLTFSKEWNYNRVNVPNIKNIIVEGLTSVFGGNWDVECLLGKGSTDITEGIF